MIFVTNHVMLILGLIRDFSRSHKLSCDFFIVMSSHLLNPNLKCYKNVYHFFDMWRGI